MSVCARQCVRACVRRGGGSDVGVVCDAVPG